jgi:hypothetical protein
MRRFSVIEFKRRNRERQSSDGAGDPEAFIAKAESILPEQSPTTALMAIDQARRALDAASTLDDVKDLRDKAEAMRIYAKQAKYSLEVQNRCAELKLRAERKAGVILGETTVKGGERHKSRRGTYERHSVLDELGISKMQSSRWQAISTIPEDIFERHVSKIKEAQTELTSASVIRLATMIQKKDLDIPKEKKRQDCAEIQGVQPGQVEVLGEEFKEAVKIMQQAIKNAKASKWQSTSKETVLKYLDLLFHVVSVDDSNGGFLLEETTIS